MTTYRTTDGNEYERYEKFLHYRSVTADVTWVPLLIGENRVRYFESSQLIEVKSPFDSGMVYCYPQEPQNFDSGLDYCYPQPAPLTVVLTPELAAHVNASAPVSIVVRKPVTLYSEWLKVA